jgi:hypothetical protein
MIRPASLPGIARVKGVNALMTGQQSWDQVSMETIVWICADAEVNSPS